MSRAYDLRLELQNVAPRVWRVLRVPADLRLDDLHHAIQCVMGWDDFHPHVFEVGDREYGPRPDSPDEEDDTPDSWAGDDGDVTVAQALKQSAGTFTYLYDFAEDWRVRVALLSELQPEGTATVTCVAGEHGGPQQDSGRAAPFSLDAVNTRLTRGLRPRATPQTPAGPRASSDQQLLAHLSLVVLMLGSRPTRHGTREAWKNIRLEVLEGLNEAGLIASDPQRKSVTLTDAGVAHAERLLQKLRAL